jgi:hypothetical protein
MGTVPNYPISENTASAGFGGRSGGAHLPAERGADGGHGLVAAFVGYEDSLPTLGKVMRRIQRDCSRGISQTREWSP